MDFARGNFIDSRWITPTGGATIRSVNPATAGEVVLEAPTSTAHAAEAVAAAARAWPAWASATVEERIAALRRFARELSSRTETLARAITAEMGKTIREARQETTSLVQRVDLVIDQQLPQVKAWSPAGVAGECRYHPLGVIGVLGPFNFPLHLCHAHIIPALATGNTVVVKPSERTPLAFQRYMEAWDAANLPPILHMVQGGADVGRALLQAPALRGVAFTGSWRVGHQITKALVDRPEVLPALEMGGQNMAIVLEDADMDQALEGVLLGGYLSAGQRCTCTARVLVQRSVAGAFIDRLVRAAKGLTFGDPMSDVFMGPMASVGDRDRVEALCRAGREAGAEVVLAPELRDGGAWRGPSIHLIADDHASDYTNEEVFGPDLAVTIVDDLDHAIQIVRSSPYGLSVGLFSARRQSFEQVYLHTNVGCVTWNRSTNRTLGSLPFGGVGKSGNHRAAGSDAVRYTTYPVQVLWNDPGVMENDPYVRQATAAADPLLALEAAHRIEEALEPYGLYPEVDATGRAAVVKIPLSQLDQAVVPLSRPLCDALKARGVAAEITDSALRMALPAGIEGPKALARSLSDALHAIRVLHPSRFLGRRPAGARLPAAIGEGGLPELPRSLALLKRMGLGDFVHEARLPLVADLARSGGAYLASVDDDPAVVLDPHAHFGTLGAGLNPAAVLEALAMGRFGALPLDGGAADGGPALAAFAARLREAAGDAHAFVRFSGTGAEAVELALATCAARRPGKRAVVAFRGAAHGHTPLALAASDGSDDAAWRDDGAGSLRARLGLGATVRFVDAPAVDALDDGHDGDDGPLAADEQRALDDLAAALADGEAVAVLVEPAQLASGLAAVGGRFVRALRAATEAARVPLVIDETRTAFGLGGPFFWHRRFALPSPPDVIALGGKSQVGVTLARSPIPGRTEIAAASALRGALVAEVAAGATGGAAVSTDDALGRFDALVLRHPEALVGAHAEGSALALHFASAEARDAVVARGLGLAWHAQGSGERSLVFELAGLDASAVAGLVERLDAAVSHQALAESLSDRATAWPSGPSKLAAGSGGSYRVARVSASDWPAIRAAYETLQGHVYEAAHRDDFDRLTALVAEPDALAFAVIWSGPQKSPAPTATAGAQKVGTLVAAAVAFPLEHVAELDGPRQDPSLGRGDALFLADLTVHPDHRGQGLARSLEEALLGAAIAQRRPDGQARYAFLTGRTREREADARALAARYGGWTVPRAGGQERDSRAAGSEAPTYFRVPLGTPRLPPSAVVTRWPTGAGPTVLDLESGLERRLGAPQGARPGNDELREHLAEGRLTGAIVNKLSLSHVVTPAVVRAHEWLRLQAPRRMRHMVVASSRCEALDRTLQRLALSRPAARTVVALGPVRAGLATAAARSVTLPAGDEGNWFGWPTLADPTRDPERALLELKKLLSDRGGADALAVILEPVYLATGRSVPETFWAPLRELTDEHQIPIVLLENATAGYRNGKSFWRADTLPAPVDAVVWYPGAQLGLGFYADRFHGLERLAPGATFDGDELSLTRLVWELRAARNLPLMVRGDALRKALAPLGEVSGEGLFLTVEHAQAESLQRRLVERGVRVGVEDRLLRVCPPLNITPEDVARLAAAVREVIQ